MRLVRFQRYRYQALGALQPDGQIVDLAAAAAAWLCFEQQDPLWEREVELRLPADVGKFIAAGKSTRELAEAAVEFASRDPTTHGIAGEPLLVHPSDVRFLQPLIAPLILSSGAIFRDGPGRNDPERNRHREFFMRNPFNLLGPSDDIVLPSWLSEEFDIAARLVVVIGHTLCSASPAQAEAAIFGYCPAIEVCALDLQTVSWAGPMFHVQYPHSRAFDGSLLLGAAVVSKDEIDKIGDRTARLVIDRTAVFEAPLATRWDEILGWISRLSQVVTLKPGTILVPGSADDAVIHPASSGDRPIELVNRSPPKRGLLRPGAEITVEIDGLGRIESRVSRSELAPPNS